MTTRGQGHHVCGLENCTLKRWSHIGVIPGLYIADDNLLVANFGVKSQVQNVVIREYDRCKGIPRASGLAQVIDLHLPEKGLGEWWEHTQDPFFDVGVQPMAHKQVWFSQFALFFSVACYLVKWARRQKGGKKC